MDQRYLILLRTKRREEKGRAKGTGLVKNITGAAIDATLA
jgi:hypothetical protein